MAVQPTGYANNTIATIFRMQILTFVVYYQWEPIKGKRSMSVDLTFLMPPLLGAVIGYVTNDIAIRMLFRPLKPVYIGKWQLPFTPGMIPKEQGRIAHAVAETISRDLLDEAALRTALLSEDMLKKVDELAEQLLQRLMTASETPEALMHRIAGEERTEQVLEGLKINVSQFVCKRLYQADIASTLTELIAEKVKRKMPFLPSSMIAPVQEQIVTWLNEMLLRDCPRILYDVIDAETGAFLQKPVGEIAAPYEEKLNALRPMLREWYARLIEAALPKILAAVNIEGIVEEKINSFSAAEMEKLLRTLMKRELSAIIWLGSILGFLMGWINVIFL